MINAYTENLADFGFREIRMLRDILNAWVENGLPDNFARDGVRLAMNRNSGHVFLVNEDYQVAMMNGEELEEFYTLPYNGDEGFLSDLISEHAPDDLHHDDAEFILNVADIAGFELQPPWLNAKNAHLPEPD